MPLDADHHTDDVARAAALLAQAGRNSLDWAALLRVVAEHRREAVEQRLDRDACDGWLDPPSDHAGRFETPLNDAELASIKVTARLYGAITRFGKEWQRVIEARAEKLNRCLENYQATDSPGPADRVAAIMELRLLFEEIGYVVRDQAIPATRGFFRGFPVGAAFCQNRFIHEQLDTAIFYRHADAISGFHQRQRATGGGFRGDMQNDGAEGGA